MVLESLGKINIKNLSIEKPEKQEELPFDPEKEITEKDWLEMGKQLEDYRKRKLWEDFSRQAMRMKILFPERVNDLHLNEKDWLAMKEEFEKDLRGNVILLYPQALSLKILFPERIHELDFSEETRQKMKKWIDYEFSHAMEMKILFPDKTSELNLNEKAWQKMKKVLEDYRGKNWWYSFSDQAKRMRIVFPERTNELNLDDQAWQGMKEQLSHFTAGVDLSSLAVNMKILAAEEVKVTDKGLEIIMPKPRQAFKKETPPLPETRNF